MRFFSWLLGQLPACQIASKDLFGANKMRLKQLRSEGWISQIPPRLRSSAFSIRVESINFNFSSRSIIYFLCLYTISLSSLEVIYFQKLQKIQIVYRGVRFQLNQSKMKDIFHWSSLFHLGHEYFLGIKFWFACLVFLQTFFCHWNDNILTFFSHRQVPIEDVTPLVLDKEEEHEYDGHVHGDDDDHHQHPTVHGHHADPANPTVWQQPKSETMSENTLQIFGNSLRNKVTSHISGSFSPLEVG